MRSLLARNIDRVAGLSPWRWPALRLHQLALTSLLLWTAIECFGPVSTKSMAWSTYDRMQQQRLWTSAPDPRLLIIDIDERSLADLAPEFGRWPWPRDTLASVLQYAEAQGARAIVFDILFSDPDRLHPGGDRALEAAVRASTSSFFTVVRLPPALDAKSELLAGQLPGLVQPGPAGGTGTPVALILPFMQAMIDSARLGTNTVQVDNDGKIRRFADTERLADGAVLRSIPAAVASHVGVTVGDATAPRLVAWRDRPDAYPRWSFSRIWQCAEGRPGIDCPALAGRILLVGATAASLHDIKTTPLAAQHMGVDILATLIDNALHGRSVNELPPLWRWVLCVAALALAWLTVRHGRAGSSAHALWALPTLLMALAYASLHSEVIYLDLTLPATAALSFLSAVKLHDLLRRVRFGQPDDACYGPWAVACGGSAAQAEDIERAVFDVAAVSASLVSGGAASSGDNGSCHASWTMWALPDARAANEIEQALHKAAPQAWRVAFAVGRTPQHDLHQAMACALSVQRDEQPRTTPEIPYVHS